MAVTFENHFKTNANSVWYLNYSSENFLVQTCGSTWWSDKYPTITIEQLYTDTYLYESLRLLLPNLVYYCNQILQQKPPHKLCQFTENILLFCIRQICLHPSYHCAVLDSASIVFISILVYTYFYFYFCSACQYCINVGYK